MSPLDAQKIIDALASGIDPETGEVLSEESPLNSPHVIRALFIASNALGATIQRIKSNDGRPGKAGKPWCDAEDKQLLQAFDGGASIRELANQHERSRGGIASRLVRLYLFTAFEARFPEEFAAKRRKRRVPLIEFVAHRSFLPRNSQLARPGTR